MQSHPTAEDIRQKLEALVLAAIFKCAQPING